ncbi:MAG: hypothetical protein AB1813_13700, partial [Verrucomicrobiota bacterium]
VAGNYGDTITVLGGNNLVLGDSGRIDYETNTGVLLTIESTAPALGGNDTITTGIGHDLVVAGIGNDTVTASDGDNIVIGDNGLVQYSGPDANLATLDLVQSTAPEQGGGVDNITAGNGHDHIIGGDAGDTITAGEGDNTILGDNGRIVRFDGALDLIASTEAGELDQSGAVSMPAQGGGDVISTGSGNDTIIAGFGSDTVTAICGNNLVIGDSGQIDYTRSTGAVQKVETIAASFGGPDGISTGDGNDVIFGGAADDTIDAGTGQNVVLGDSGFVDNFTADGNTTDIDRIESVDTAIGGSDWIATGDGDDLVIGGAGGDTINAGTGENLVIGDSGRIISAMEDGSRFGNQPITLGLVTTITSAIGGADQISTDAGNDLILGGAMGDQLFAGDGHNIVFGDNGLVDWVVQEREPATLSGDLSAADIDLLVTLDPTIGGVDMITTGNGADLVIAGQSGDTVMAGEGNNIVIGDSGRITSAPAGLSQFGANSLPITLGRVESGGLNALGQFSTESQVGGADAIMTGAGQDLVLGGIGNDVIQASDGNNLVIGDSGYIDYVNADADAADIDEVSTTEPNDGGADSIQTGAGNDILIGGDDMDVIDAGSGANVVLGDNALVQAASANTPRFGNAQITVITLGTIQSTDPIYGGPDQINISGGGGNDLILGGTGDDVIYAQDGNDLVFGDHGLVQGVIDLAQLPLSNNEPFTFTSIATQNSDLGGVDTIYAGSGQDIVIGGQMGDRIYGEDGADDLIGGHNVAGGQDGNDRIDGGQGNDVIAGDNAEIERNGNTLSPRFRVLTGTQLYKVINGIVTADIDVTSAAQQNPTTAGGSSIEERSILIYDHTFVIEAGDSGTWGADYLAGGSDDDVIFGQLGNDVIQGDGSVIGLVPSATDAAATRSGAGLVVTPSIENLLSDGDDYIEGGGGDDVIFGNQGQDDLIGGSSNLFGLSDRLQRPDGSDLIFGGSGNEIDRNDDGNLAATGHAHDADVILGDNGVIFRIVGVNGAVGVAGTTVQSFNGLLAFAYDNFSAAERVIVRAAQWLDYTPGGADFNSAAAALDIGAADEIHGESGDDWIYGLEGDDLLFGEGQDDDLIGGYGADWISGGTGADGVLGDDGRISTSRNGTAEPLYGIAATTQTLISTPGKVQQATIHVTGQLKKTVNLTPFNIDPNTAAQDPLFRPQFANDIIYGGLGNDALHGGSGDDAISGAEALPQFYNAPFNPGNVLGWGYADTTLHERRGEFAAYDEYNPWRRIKVDENGLFTDGTTGAEFLLNFDASEGPNDSYGAASGYAPVGTDGDDVLFGDLGNDWLVGGSGKDHLYGGWGDDLMNADDQQDTNGGLNDQPDTHPSYEDLAYGGAGRDILIGNTGGDRLIDWAGEFNSYIVPFAPFGLATISRSLQPGLMEFLYSLSRSDGADPTRAADTGSDPARNGEPEGEIGLVKQSDFAWRDQTGAPDDPQPGNIPGGRRDVLRSANFNDGQAQGFMADSGNWTVSNGRFEVAPTALGGDAVSVFYVDAYRPNYFEMQATINADKPVAGSKANAYLIFDYQSPTDFKFAGINVATNKLEMGHRDASGWHVDKQTNSQVKPNTDYNMLLAVNGVTATLLVNNKTVFSYAFNPRVIDGFSYGLNTGMVGIGTDNAKGRIDNVAVQILPPVYTLQETDNFTSASSSRFGSTLTGNWSRSGGRYNGSPSGAQDWGLSTINLGLSPNALLEMETKLSTTSSAGIVFDYYNADNFKFATLDVISGQVLIGHRTSKGWTIDAAVSRSLQANKEYTFGVTVKGTTVSITLDGQAVMGHVFNSALSDGQFGVLTRNGASAFDSFTFKTDDSKFL